MANGWRNDSMLIIWPVMAQLMAYVENNESENGNEA